MTDMKSKHSQKKITETAKEELIHKANVKPCYHCTEFNFPVFAFKKIHLASYTLGTSGSFPGIEAAGA
jgi:hypothetical protein